MGLAVWVLSHPSTLPTLPDPLANLPWFRTELGPPMEIEFQTNVNNPIESVQNCYFTMASGRISQVHHPPVTTGQALIQQGGWATLGPILSCKLPGSNQLKHYSISTRHMLSDVSNLVTVFNEYRANVANARVIYKAPADDWALLEILDTAEIDCVTPNITVAATQHSENQCKFPIQSATRRVLSSLI